MLRFNPNPLGSKQVADIAIWLSKSEAQLVRQVVEAKIVELEVKAIEQGVEAHTAGREHTLQSDESFRQTIPYRHFIQVLDELATGQNLFTGQVAITK